MDVKLKKLPVGIQTFETIIEDNFLYVDKTKYLVELIENGKIYFLARPRRFGKSLTVTTLDAMFSGKKDLFKGLYAEAWMNRKDYQSYPIIRLSLNAVTTCLGLVKLQESICLQIKYCAEKLSVQLIDSDDAGNLFDDLIRKAYTHFNKKVVVLIDEYDKPYIDFYNKPDIADQVREMLANFYVRIKANDEYLHFVFLTGVSKFAKMGVFSKLNNLRDISLNKEYGTLCGITHEELLENFSGHLELTAKEMEISKQELIDKVENFYDGFSFDGKTKLYNPFSTLLFFSNKAFCNYWFDSGTTTMMSEYIKKNNFTVEQFRNIQTSVDFLQNPGEIDTASPEGFLYQNGFLTLREGITNDFSLDYPNKEVLDSMSRLMSRNLLKEKSDDLSNLLLFSIVNNDFEELKDTLNCLLASIPYDDFASALKQKIKGQGYKFPVQEWLYRSTIFAFMRGCGLVVQAEMHTNRGRADLVLNYRGKIFILEFKVAYAGENPLAKLEEAKTQIINQRYKEPYPNAIAIALVIDDEKRQITELAEV